MMVRRTIVGLSVALLLAVSNAYALDETERDLSHKARDAKKLITDADRKCEALSDKVMEEVFAKRSGSVNFDKLANMTQLERVIAVEPEACCTADRKDLRKQAITQLQVAASRGSDDAMIELGEVYSTQGCPGEMDLDESVRWYTLAAYNMGSVQAMEKLGDLYGNPAWPASRRSGNKLEAFSAYAHAAKKGSAYGWIRMGQMKMEKYGWDRNDVLGCFLEAFKLDPRVAGLSLGEFYEKEGNIREAIRYYRMSDTFTGQQKANELEGK